MIWADEKNRDIRSYVATDKHVKVNNLLLRRELKIPWITIFFFITFVYNNYLGNTRIT